MLQARLTTLHVAQLLSDNELFVLEDVLADYMVAMPAGGTLAAEHPAAARLQSLLALSEGFSINDAAFVRQVGTMPVAALCLQISANGHARLWSFGRRRSAGLWTRVPAEHSARS